MSTLFYHGMQPRRTTLCKINTMFEIIESGGLKSNRLLGNYLAHGYNGLDYISVCAKGKIYKYINNDYSAFNIFIKNNFCFIISGEVPAVKTLYINYDKFTHYNDLVEYMDLFSGQQFSDLFDEWQVKDEIPLCYIVGLGIPIKRIMKYKGYSNEIIRGIEHLYMLARLFNWDIVDSSSFFSFYNYEKVKSKNKLR